MTVALHTVRKHVMAAAVPLTQIATVVSATQVHVPHLLAVTRVRMAQKLEWIVAMQRVEAVMVKAVQPMHNVPVGFATPFC